MIGKKKSADPDGTEITETRNKVKKTYPNGDFETTNKKTGATTSWSRIRPDGKRERDGR